MSEKLKQCFSMFRRRFLRRGQVAVFYALMIPVFFFVGGVGLDLGWYYLNVSRLQNAADAAVLVGADKLITEDNTFKGKNYKAKLVSQFPADEPVNNIDTMKGDNATRSYAMKNLAARDLIYAPPKIFSIAQAATVDPFYDGYTRGNPKVTMTTSLYKDGDEYYYVLHLTEDIHHFFIGFLDDMEAPVVAVAKLYSEDQALIFDANGGHFTDTTTTEEHYPVDWTKYFTPDKGTPIYTEGNTQMKTFRGYWTTLNGDEQQEALNNNESIPTYRDNLLLTSVFTREVATQQHDSRLLDFVKGKTNTITFYALWDKATPHNNKTLWEQMQYLIAKNVYNDYWYAAKAKYGGKRPYQNSFVYLAKYNVNGEIAYYTENINLSTVGKWDETKNLAEATHYYIDFYQSDRSELKLGDGVSKNDYAKKRRAHSLFNVDIAYDVRTKNGERIHGDDPLYCRIEAEPYISENTYIRQMVINVNVDNTDDDKRPLFFFYGGPDARTVKNDDGNGEKILTPEEAQPVILNLNADFKGVLWMPDIPVVINGNGHKFEGFIIAKEFRYLDTTQGRQVEYSTKGRKTPSADDPQSIIRIDPATGNVYSIVAENNSLDTDNKTYAYNIFKNNNNVGGTSGFNLSNDSCFRKFELEEKVNFMYVAYDFDCNMKEAPFHEYGDITKPLIPLYKLDENGKEVQVTEWADVKLYDKPKTDSTRKEIPKKLDKVANNRESVRLDSNGSPSPLYDEAGNPVYFSEDYVRLDDSYNLLTLDRVADGSRDRKEFLLTMGDTLSNTDADKDDWK